MLAISQNSILCGNSQVHYCFHELFTPHSWKFNEVDCSGAYTNEINSPGRTANHLTECWLADSFFSWSYVSAWKIPISNEELCLEKLVFIACDFMSIMKIGEEGHKTFTYACITLLPRVKRENSYINQPNLRKSVFLMVLASYWLQSWRLRNFIPFHVFARGLA